MPVSPVTLSAAASLMLIVSDVASLESSSVSVSLSVPAPGLPELMVIGSLKLSTVPPAVAPLLSIVIVSSPGPVVTRIASAAVLAVSIVPLIVTLAPNTLV